jgi:alpha-L-arabinofuranosidase
MNLRKITIVFWAVCSCLFPVLVRADDTTAVLEIDVNKPGVTIPPSFGGLMTEEINHSYDGGLYAELIQNRTFQDDPANPVDWSLIQKDGATLKVDRSDPVNPALPVSLRLDLTGDVAGVANDGFWGIPVRPDTPYTASFYARAGNGFTGPLTAAIVTDDGSVTVASGQTEALTDGWKKYTVKLTTAHDAKVTAHAKFVVSASGKGSVWLSLVSLFPPTFEDAPNGLRPDLMKLMADMKPAFIRLPGGNYLEGDTFATRFDWKKMIGPVDQRPGHMGCWKYRSSDGFGLPEFLLWCQQLKAEPVLALFAGYTLNNDYVPAGKQLQPYVDEALQEIEYVSGPADSTWGKQRAADGFTQPFKLRYVEVGNEDFFDKSGSYEGRFAQFFDAIRAKYPDLKIIATRKVKSRPADLVDEHYYLKPQKMASTSTRYDGKSRSGPQVFAGEWASQEGKPTPDLNAALGDAVWVMGLERDADVVPIECYAPLLVNVNPGAWQWPTNLIGYDALSSFGSPSYYAQCMLAQNRGDRVLPAKLSVTPPKVVNAAPAAHGAIGLGVWQTDSEYKDIVITHGAQALLTVDPSKGTDGWRFNGGQWGIADSSIKPLKPDAETWAVLGDPAWTDYTITLKARKNGGSEGFLILFHAADDDNYSWWNIGGFKNTRTSVEVTREGSRDTLGTASDFNVQTGKWYDLRIEVTGDRMRGFIDNKLVTDVTEDRQPQPGRVYASATYDSTAHQVIAKVVNFGGDAIDGTLKLAGCSKVDPAGKAIVLSGSLKDRNTVEEPTKVAPKEAALSDASAEFHRTFPPHSLTLLRLSVTTAP